MKTFALTIFLSGILIPLLVEAAQINRDKKNAVLVEKFKIDNSKLLTDDYLRSDNFAIGVLRANKWNTVASSKFLKQLLAWRASNKIAQLGESPTHIELYQYFPYRSMARTKDGCPVLEIDAGKWRTARFMEFYPFERDAIADFMKYTTQMFEKSRRPLSQGTSKCDQAIMVVNARDLSINYDEPNVIGTALRLVTNLEKHFPNLYKKILIINSNPDVTNFLNTVLPYLGETSISIRLFSEDEEDEAKQLISQYIYLDELIMY